MTNPEIQRITRLDQSVYQTIETRFSKPVVTSNTTAIEVGYQLGVQAVLQFLRTNMVIDTP